MQSVEDFPLGQLSPWSRRHKLSCPFGQGQDMDTKVHLRHVHTGLYYSGWHTWTTDPRQAINFGNSERAFLKAEEEELSQVQVVMRQEDPLREMILPVV